MNATIRVNLLRLAVLMVATAVPAVGLAETLIDGEGFESPAYSTAFSGTGQLEGQLASTIDGPIQWLQSGVGGTGTAVIQTSVVASGDQAVEVNRMANSDDRWAVPLATPATGPLVLIKWDMYVEETTASAAFGPYFGIEAYDDDTNSFLRVASLGVDATTGDVLYTLRDDGVQSGFLVETGSTVSFDSWNSFRIELDYVAGSYDGYVNDVLVVSTAFEQDGADSFTDADLTAIAASGDPTSLALTGTAYFDNYLVTQIPEPTTLMLLVLALLPGGRRS